MVEQDFKEDVFNVLRLISLDNISTQRDISRHLGISLGKTNYLLRALTQKGLIKIKNFTHKKGKLKKVRYLLTRKGFEKKLNLAVFFLERKEKEYLTLKRELDQLQVGYSEEIKV